MKLFKLLKNNGYLKIHDKQLYQIMLHKREKNFNSFKNPYLEIGSLPIQS